MNNKKYYREM